MKYNKERVDKIVARLKNGATHLSAALSTGINEDTFYEWMKKPEFSEQIKAAEAYCQARCEAIVQQAAIKSWQAAAWYLERRQSTTYALKQRLDHTGIEAAPITIHITPAESAKAVRVNANDSSQSD